MNDYVFLYHFGIFLSVQDWNIYFFYFLILMVLLKGMKLIGIKTKQMNAYN